MDYPRTPSYIVIAYDATKDRDMHELMLAVHGVLKGGDIVRRGDTILVLGVLHRVTHPMGYRTIPCPDSKGTSIRAVKEAVKREIDGYVNMLLQSAEQCEDQGVSLEVKVTAGFPIKQVILQEIAASKAAWVVLDRHLKQCLGFYITHVPCKIALVEDTLEVEIVRPHSIGDTDKVKQKWFYSLSKRVPVLDCRVLIGNNQQAIISCGRRYFVSINSLENRTLPDFPAATYIWAERDKKAHGRASTSARTNKDRLIQKERAARGGRIHLFIDHCLCWTERQQG